VSLSAQKKAKTEVAMAKIAKTKETSPAKHRGMSDHPHGSLSVPENKLVGGEPIFGSDQGLDMVSPDPRVPVGQTTHE
jgi:hypothetical protein